MNTDNQPTPDDGYRNAWKQAFDDASETPPPRVWQAIERQLQTDDRARLVPLWWAPAQPWATGIAAAVTLVLIGWWSWHKLTPGSPDAHAVNGISVVRQSDTRQPVEKPELNRQSSVTRTTASADLASTTPTASTRSLRPDLMPSSHDPLRHPPTAALTDSVETLVQATQHERPSAPIAAAKPSGQPSMVSSIAVPIYNRNSQMPAAAPVLIGFGQVSRQLVMPERIAVVSESERLWLAVDELTGKPVRNHQPGIQRVVWFRTDDPILVAPEQSTSGERGKWASVSVMPSAYNPVARVQLQPMSFVQTAAYANAISYTPATATPMLRSESGVAIAVQASVGAQLNDRWSVETGVGYVQAQSTVISPTQVIPLTLNNSAGRTLYTAVVQNSLYQQSALANNSAAYDKSASIPTGLYTSQTEGRTRSDYNFVQVPAQVGYQLRPRRKLGLSLLGGLLTNWFVRNAVGETLVVKPSDNVYRSLTLAGTAGARFRYRPSRRWSASLAGIYQQSLQIGTLSDVSLETRPHTVGVSFGMDYHF